MRYTGLNGGFGWSLGIESGYIVDARTVNRHML